ncbi:hypothetical protein [Litorilituus lipolyticus]|uniref:Uncharacterized protein n=1 Tax=Litorilituus lipolyticus TaxID=2491017 RepID=A0A502KRR4_9GAMM|nr:hypothetical protein [Litorilituus lipolyticus]TPH12895.1 hypothetical protein EPA86_15905 [Litorilituus lipolyticus]
MCATWKHPAKRLMKMIDANKETQAHMYLEQFLLFPVDVQDSIIEDISHLSNCNSDAVANIIGNHAMVDLR